MKIKSLMTKLCCITLSSLPLSVMAHGIAFVHSPHYAQGSGDVTVQWQADNQNQQLNITAIYPALDVVGFEHIPQNAQEKRALRKAYQRFIDYPIITATACTPAKVDVQSVLFDDHSDSDDSGGFLESLLGNDKAEPPVVDNQPMDFAVSYQFKCSQISPLTFKHFAAFPSLTAIRVFAGDLTQPVLKKLTSNDLQIPMIPSQP
ncbi:MAG TPA: DUF2796 domain-containing protein [Thiothrix sp.]|nr:DUF2796 domain-containing protein [Thiothrix sp.]